jgi:hypothetical protein
MFERAIESSESQSADASVATAKRQSTTADVQGLFSDQLTEEEKKTLASLGISSDASAERLAGRLTALCRAR